MVYSQTRQGEDCTDGSICLESSRIVHADAHECCIPDQWCATSDKERKPMMDSENHIADRAINNETLYKAVLEHRRKFIGLKGFNYDELYPTTLCIVPNEDIAKLWQDDYMFMCEHMIFGQVPSFEELINKLSTLNDLIKQLNYRKT